MLYVSMLVETRPPLLWVQVLSQKGHGSAVVVDPRGYAVTCRHVVGDSQKATVWLKDGTALVAEVVAVDVVHDLALLKVVGGELRFLPRALAPEPARVGDTVWARGHPKGLSHTLTKGVVSATGRTVVTGDGTVFPGVLQTDAAINPGNSGGELLDVHGRLVGVPACIYEGAQGISFAISVDRVRKFLDKHLLE